jgi:hypothetical protein
MGGTDGARRVALRMRLHMIDDLMGGVDVVTGEVRGMNGPPPAGPNGAGYHPREITLADITPRHEGP